jgi:hypothetical protein
MLLATGGALYGQGAMEALFIDQQGNVGVGTRPAAKLDVAGTAVIRSDVKGGSKELVRVDQEGRVGIGNPTAEGKLDVAGTVRLGRGIAESWFPFSDNNAYISGQQTIIRSGVAGNHAEFVRVDQEGRVSIGNPTPQAKLDVAGTVRLGRGIAESWFPFSDNNAYISGQQTIIRSGVAGNHAEFVRVDQQGRVGIGTQPAAAYKLDVSGNTRINGTLEVTNLTVAGQSLRMVADGPVGIAGRWNNGRTGYAVLDSDVRLKTDIQPLAAALEKIRQLRGVTYLWNRQALDYFTSDVETTISAGLGATREANRELWQKEREKRYQELSRTNLGVIAQEVEAVMPEAVTTDEKGYKAVRYHYLVPLLIEAIKEQDKVLKGQAEALVRQHEELERLAAAQQSLRHQVGELGSVRAQLVELQATVHRGAAARALVTRDPSPYESGAPGR